MRRTILRLNQLSPVTGPDGRVFIHVTPFKNVRSIETKGLQPRVLKRGLFSDSRTEKRIYLFTDPDTAEDALSNWLADEYEDARYFGILQVHVPPSIRVLDDPELAGAVYVTQAIPTSDILAIDRLDAGESD